MSNDDGFTVVKKKIPKVAEPEVMEEVWAFSSEWDWAGSAGDAGCSAAAEGHVVLLKYVKIVQSFRDLRRSFENARWYHGYSPCRNLIYGKVDGKMKQFKADKEYRFKLRNQSSVPPNKLMEWETFRKERKFQKEQKKKAGTAVDAEGAKSE
jgi:hypothetical protein